MAYIEPILYVTLIIVVCIDIILNVKVLRQTTNYILGGKP